jgi:hypothetical protein
LCRPPLDGRPTCPSGDACVQGIGDGTRPDYNVCQKVCTRPSDCGAPQACLWREVVGGAAEHGFVCAVPPANRRPLGAACERIGTGGDEVCTSGLCYDGFCTRPCAAANDTSCTDVAPDAKCCIQQLRYGIKEYQAYVCVRGGTSCG